MPRPRPPYLHLLRTRHGKPVWYFNKRPGPRIRIKSTFGTPEFDAEYQAALSGEYAKATRSNKAAAGSLEWLWTRYRETPAWTDLSASTRKSRENIMAHVLKKGGHSACTSI